METPSHASPADPTGDAPIFTATLSPYRSLSRRGFNILMGAAAVVSFAFGIAFLSLGAWPVFGFFGLDVLILYLAFRRNYLDAAARETIDLTRGRLLISRVTARGVKSEYAFNPYWTRLVVDRKSWGVATVSLTSRGDRLVVGSFLNPNERASFAAALSKALATARAS